MIPVIQVDQSKLQVAIGQLSDTWKNAAATALNLTGEDALADQRQKFADDFHIRAPSFDLPLAAIPGAYRATPSRLAVEVSVGYSDGPQSVGGRRQAIFGKFETQQTLQAKTPATPFFWPTPRLRPSIGDVVSPKLYPRNLLGQFNANGELTGFGRRAKLSAAAKRAARRTLAVGGASKVAKQSTASAFVIGQPGERRFGIYERIGKARSDIVMIWFYMEQQPIPKLLNWDEDVRKVVGERWPINWEGAFQRSMAGTLWNPVPLSQAGINR